MLNEDQFGEKTTSYFHVSERDFKPGDVLTPGEHRSEQNIVGEGGDNKAVFMADSQDDAWLWGGLLVGPKTRVLHTYEVEPQGGVERRSAESFTGDIEHEYLAPSARVVRRVTSEKVNPADHGY